jgi:type II secretory pathway pseudopilin PulG
MYRRRRLHSAFTLVELIVVEIVLGLLLAVALPYYFGTFASARDPAARTAIADHVGPLEQNRNVLALHPPHWVAS